MENGKYFTDIHNGPMYFDPLAVKIVDTPEFRRLHDLKQLGFAHMVYPSALHSRFEHSLSVYHLAEALLYDIKLYQGSELDITEFDLQTVKLAGLLHDIGHLPFSHMFENMFLPQVAGADFGWSRANMSTAVIDLMVDNNNIDVADDVLKKVKEMVVASCDRASLHSSEEKGFLYDVVASRRNGIDVDKFDCIYRDSKACGCSYGLRPLQSLVQTMKVKGNELCYRKNEYLAISNVLYTDSLLHRRIYGHQKVKAIELMFADVLAKANPTLGIASTILSPATFLKLNDTIINGIETHSQELKESKELIRRIRTTDLYQCCGDFPVPIDKVEHLKIITAEDVACSQSQAAGGQTLVADDIAVTTDIFVIKDDRIKHLCPYYSQGAMVKVYAKKPQMVKAVKAAFENVCDKLLWRQGKETVPQPYTWGVDLTEAAEVAGLDMPAVHEEAVVHEEAAVDEEEAAVHEEEAAVHEEAAAVHEEAAAVHEEAGKEESVEGSVDATVPERRNLKRHATAPKRILKRPSFKRSD